MLKNNKRRNKIVLQNDIDNNVKEAQALICRFKKVVWKWNLLLLYYYTLILIKAPTAYFYKKKTCDRNN